MKRVAILISGGGSNMKQLVAAMQGSDFAAQPVMIGSNDPQAGGLAWAQQAGLPCFAVDHRDHRGDRPGFEAELTRHLDAAAPDVICLAGFMRILTPDFVRRYAGRMLNIHPSLLPKYPGLNTHQRAIEAGDREAGATVHEVTAELDAGPILGQARVPLRADDSADTLAARVLRAEHVLYPRVLRRFCAETGGRLELGWDEISAM